MQRMGGRSRAAAEEANGGGEAAGSDLESGYGSAGKRSRTKKSGSKKADGGSREKGGSGGGSKKSGSKKKSASTSTRNDAVASKSSSGGSVAAARVAALKRLMPRGYSSWGAWILVTLITLYAIDIFSIAKSPENAQSAENPAQAARAAASAAASAQQQLEQQRVFDNAAVAAGAQQGRSSAAAVKQTTKDVTSAASTSSSATHVQIKSDSDSSSNSVKTSSAPVSGGSPSSNAAVSASNTREELAKVSFTHPMNRGVEHLMVSGGVEKLSTDQVKEAYRRLALTYLHPFKKGISRAAFFTILNRKSYGVTPEGANKGTQSILFQIVGGKVFMFDPYKVIAASKDFHRSRINEMIWLLSKMAEEKRIHDTEFLVSIHDCVQTASAHHTYRGARFVESSPSFTIVACNFSDNIPFPMWEGDLKRGGGYATWDDKMRSYASDYVPWVEKKPRAVFRGGNRPSMLFGDKAEADLHCDTVGRSRLMHLSQVHSNMFDVSIGGKCGSRRFTLNRMSPDEHHRFKYIIYAEGNCFWADRLNRQLFGPSAIIKQETPCGQFYEPLLRPMVHYIPTDFYFKDLVYQIQLARESDPLIQGIVRNANSFAHNFLSLRGIEAYVEVLLYEYTSLLIKRDIVVEPGAREVTGQSAVNLG